MELQKIGKLLTETRIRRKKTKYRIQKDTGLHDSVINAIESGESGYNVTSLLSYCKAVNMDFVLIDRDYIITSDTETSP